MHIHPRLISFLGVAFIACGGEAATPSPSSSPPAGKADGILELCAGVAVDGSGIDGASAAIQRCADERGEVSLPPGVYRIDQPILITRPTRIFTEGLGPDARACLDTGGPRCATLRADAGLVPERGMIRVLNTHDVSFEHVVLDGNRAMRRNGEAAKRCTAGQNGAGMNMSLGNCTSCAFVLSASINALCGSGLEWDGAGARVLASIFRDNGDHETAMMWSDGLTLLRSEQADVESNLFVDNSDVDLIFGGGTRAVVRGNHVSHGAQTSFAGLMLDNFNGTTPGDFTETEVSHNVIECGAQRCDFGLMIGPHNWYLSQNTIGGEVTDNSIAGAKLNIEIEGGGTDAAPVVLSRNHYGASPPSATFHCGTRPSTAFNVSPDARVQLSDQDPPTGAFVFHQCE